MRLAAAACCDCRGDLQIVALAGRNADLLKRLQALAKQHPGKLFPIGFTTTVERVMTAADLVVTKPGGLSVSECLAKRRPMLLVSPIPGQEERNADYLLEAGAAIKAVDGATLEFKLARLLADRARLRRHERGGAAESRGRARRRRGCANIRVAMKRTRFWSVLPLARGARRSRRSAAGQAPPAVAARPAQWAEPIALEGVPNLHRISPTLYRSEQPTALGMKNLEKLGIRTVINLRALQRRRGRGEGHVSCAPSARRSSPGASTTSTSSKS